MKAHSSFVDHNNVSRESEEEPLNDSDLSTQALGFRRLLEVHGLARFSQPAFRNDWLGASLRIQTLHSPCD
jgi:hypothetical protein